jgi:beta-phosphoglucomutase family hydrolase
VARYAVDPDLELRAFIFDMDGTIVDNYEYHIQSWLALFAELGMEMSPGQLRQRIGGNTSPSFLRQVLGPDVSDAQIVEYAERKECLYRSLFHPHLKPVAGLLEFLAAARHLRVPVALATSAGGRNIQFVLDGLGIAAYFDAVIGGDDVPQGKRGPELFLASAQGLGVQPGSCLAFEDSLAGIQAASMAGMRTIVVATNHEAGKWRALPSVLDVVVDFTSLDPASLLGIGGERGESSWKGAGE